MKKIISTLTLILTASVAYAEPVYLDCNIPGMEDSGRNFSVRLDEANGKISQTYVNMPFSSFNTIGIYSPNSISYSPDESTTYKIDRATLSILYIGRSENKEFPSPGQCTLAKEVKGNKI